MKKSLLISIQPQWLYKILKGDKTYEVRKVVPKWMLESLDRGEPVEAYLYCTKSGQALSSRFKTIDGGGNELYYTLFHDRRLPYMKILNGTIPVKVVIDGYDTYYLERPLNLEVAYRGIKNEHGCEYSKDIKADLIKHSGLTFTQLFDYGTKRFDGQQSVIKALHISKVEILDEVMKLDDFTTTFMRDDAIIKHDMGGNKYFYYKDRPAWHFYFSGLKRPPQSFMTVWVK